MKKLYFILFIIVTSPIFSQTELSYSVDVEYYRGVSGCDYTNVPAQTRKTCDANTTMWALKNGTTTLISENITSTASIIKTYSIPVSTSYNFSAQVFCSCSGGVPSVPYYVCSEIANQVITNTGYTYSGTTYTSLGIIQSLTGGGNAGGFSINPSTQVCIGTVMLKNFKPNGIVISKPGYNLYPNGVLTPPEYIAGEMIDLIATAGSGSVPFPSEVYHWQYSIDNKATWIDLPVVAGKTTINTPTPSFTIEDILGNDHVNHFGPIDFRLGYSSRAFTDSYRIIYTAGTPVLKKIVYQGPKCAGDNIQSLIVYFDRDLNPNEDIAPLYVQKTTLSTPTPLQSQPVVKQLTYDAATDLYKYSFVDLGNLENNAAYKINYQARMSTVPRGTLTSSTQTFTYEEPQILSFQITDQQKPSCVGGNDGFIEVTITSGTSPFHFYKNSTEVTPDVSNGKYYIRNLPEGNYDIIVTDTSGCIDKNAND